MGEFLKFNIVGFINTIVDFIVYFLLLKLGIGYKVAATVSYATGVVNSYFWNRGWTFKVKKEITKKEILKFILLNVICWGISLGVLVILYNLGFNQSGLKRLIAKGFASLVPAVVNFLGNKKWIFSR